MTYSGGPTWTDPRNLRPATLVDRLFLLCHDERTGKPHLSLDVLGVGLVGAVLIELLQRGAVVITGDPGKLARLTSARQSEPAAQYVLEQIAKAEPHVYTPADWISVLRDDLYPGVANSLAEAGLIQVEKPKIGRGVRCIPIDVRIVQESLAWVYGILGTGEFAPDEPDPTKHLLACVCAALGVAPLITARPAAHVDALYPAMLERLDPQTAIVLRSITHARGRLALKTSR